MASTEAVFRPDSSAFRSPCREASRGPALSSDANHELISAKTKLTFVGADGSLTAKAWLALHQNEVIDPVARCISQETHGNHLYFRGNSHWPTAAVIADHLKASLAGL